MTRKIIVLLGVIVLLTAFCGKASPEGKWKLTIDHDFFKGNSYFPSGEWSKVLDLTANGDIEDSGRVVGNWESYENSDGRQLVTLHIKWKFGGIEGFELEGSIDDDGDITGMGKIKQGKQYAQFRNNCFLVAVREK